MSEPGRIKPVAYEPNVFTCARGQSCAATERTFEIAALCTGAWSARWCVHLASYRRMSSESIAYVVCIGARAAFAASPAKCAAHAERRAEAAASWADAS